MGKNAIHSISNTHRFGCIFVNAKGKNVNQLADFDHLANLDQKEVEEREENSMARKWFSIMFMTLVTAQLAFGQAFRPFKSNATYHFTDSLMNWHSVRIAPGVAVGNDTIFEFNLVTTPLINPPGAQNCDGVLLEPKYEVGKANTFGFKMIQKPGGQYVFVQAANATNDSLFLYTNGKINSTKVFAKGTGETATLASIGLYSVFGITDTVKTWNISNGRKIRISRNFGIIEGHDFLGYADGGSITDLQLRSFETPLIQMGTPPPSFHDIFDYEVGDKMTFKTEIRDANGDIVTEEWKWFEITGVDPFPAVNHVNYTVSADLLGIYSSPGGSQKDTILVKGEITTWKYEVSDFPQLDAVTGEFVELSTGSGLVLESIEANSAWHDRTQYTFGANVIEDTCNGWLSSPPDQAWRTQYTEGLGLTRSWDPENLGNDTRLLCYTKGTETAGTCPTLASIVSRDIEVPTFDLQVYPNPASSEVNIAWGEVKPNVNVRVLDLMGRVIWSSNVSGASTQIGTSNWNAGTYLVALQSADGSKAVSKLMVTR